MPSNPNIFPPENNLKQADFESITSGSLPQIIALFNQENNATTRRATILKKIKNPSSCYFIRLRSPKE